MRYLLFILTLFFLSCSNNDGKNNESDTNSEYQFEDQAKISGSMEIGLDNYLTLTLDGEAQSDFFKVRHLEIKSKDGSVFQKIEGLDYNCENYEGTLQVSFQDYNWDGKDDFSVLEIDGVRHYWLYSEDEGQYNYHSELSAKQDLTFTDNQEVIWRYTEAESGELFQQYYHFENDSLINYRSEADIDYTNGFKRKFILEKKGEYWSDQKVFLKDVYHENLEQYNAFYNQQELQVLFGDLLLEDEADFRELREVYSQGETTLKVPQGEDGNTPVVVGYAIDSSRFLSQFKEISDDEYPIIYEDNPGGVVIFTLKSAYQISSAEFVLEIEQKYYYPYEEELEIYDKEPFYCYSYYDEENGILYLPFQGKILVAEHQWSED